MKKIYNLFFLIIFCSLSAQNLQKIAREITDEGILLYKSEMASWYGTDVFLANFKDREKIGGYFSYIDEDIPKCIFFSKDQKILGTISFPTNYNPENSKVDMNSRDFTPTELAYYKLRKEALTRMESDTIFKKYDNTNFNLVPIITNKTKKVYVITGTNLSNKVIFGNDYLLTFNLKDKIIKTERLHKSLIVQNIVDEKTGKTISGVHSHIIKDWQYMTPTDICTLMLNQKFTNWEDYTVVSEKYTSIWNSKNNSLMILKTDVVKKIMDDQRKRHPEKFDK